MDCDPGERGTLAAHFQPSTFRNGALSHTDLNGVPNEGSTPRETATYCLQAPSLLGTMSGSRPNSG